MRNFLVQDMFKILTKNIRSDAETEVADRIEERKWVVEIVAMTHVVQTLQVDLVVTVD